MRATSPSLDGLTRLSEALGESIRLVRPLHGGVASSVHELRGSARKLVLKRFLEPDSARLEWERLELARTVGVPTPEPLALDLSGRWFGLAALVVGYLEGEPMYPPQPEVLGRVLAVIHSTQLHDTEAAVLHRPALWQLWEDPGPSVRLPVGLAAAIGRLQSVAAADPVVFCHCDFHPGNVLVDQGAVSGVIDWSGARLSPAGFDVGLARCDMALEPGGDAPDRLLAAYEEASGITVANLWLWDGLAAARALESGHGWVEAWTEIGVPMTAELIEKRATGFALAALGGAPAPEAD